MTGHHTTGVQNTGMGSVTVHGDVSATTSMTSARTDPGEQPADVERSVEVGILTVLDVEMKAVLAVLRHRPAFRARQLPGGVQAYEARVDTVEGVIRVAAIQTLEPGQLSAGLAYHCLRRHYAPAVVLLVGVAGGIRSDVRIGDVVIGEQVIYYEARRVSVDGTTRRGRDHPMAATVRRRVQAFIQAEGEVGRDEGASFRVHRGPIGSGEAVVAHAGSDIRAYLAAYNDKTLAVDTEAAGVAQAFYEQIDQDRSLRGWLTVRGISDLADARKSDDLKDVACRRAATVVDQLLPYLRLA
jgi:adenosylhomocysteine nucleosidase